jgi:membrane-associated HD superfamily phosphohydrolase
LTDDELKKIGKYLADLLISYYHERIKYPEKNEGDKKG